MLNQNNIKYIESCLKRKLVKEELDKIKKHCDKYNTSQICAWYSDWEDFCSDWCDQIGYSRNEARKLFHGGKGEFKIIDSIGILRFDI